MVSEYLDMLEKSTNDKIALLESLTNLSEKQKAVVSAEEVDWDEFDKIVDDKGILVDRLNSLDDGFETLYDRIKNELEANKHSYKEKIQNIQNLIVKVTELSTSLMALEQRNKVLVENSFKSARQKLNQNKVNSRVASNYYKAMSRVNFIDPQLMDKKK